MNKPHYKNIIFDLDGTLTDSQEGIVNSMKAAMNALGRKIPGQNLIRGFIGIPLQELFLNHFRISAGELEKAVFHFRNYYTEKGIFENKLYPGIEELLIQLNQGSTLFVATSKFEKNALRVLRHFNMDGFFTGMAGANSSGTHSGKTELVEKLLNDFHINRDATTVMVGDTTMDLKAAEACNIDSIGVTYGYGLINELAKCNPTYLVNSVEELATILLSD